MAGIKKNENRRQMSWWTNIDVLFLVKCQLVGEIKFMLISFIKRVALYNWKKNENPPANLESVSNFQSRFI